MGNNYPYKQETFVHYLFCQVKVFAQGLLGAWMMVLAPGGMIILGIFASCGQEKFGTEVCTYLWYAFGFCALCTLTTIFYALYDGYRKSKGGIK